ncbi:MAG TPA: Gfo/Idh/MocA family oxidoreductase [Candidatus Binataceae bacterium]
MNLRGAISGFGEVALRAHIPGWRTRKGVSIVAVHDPVAERRHDAIREIKSVRVYDDLELMLDGEAPDFVDIASPPAYHAGATRLALKAKAHVLVEKPLCLTLAEFDELAALASGNDRVLMCVHNWKYAPSLVVARHAYVSGRIGPLRSLTLDRLRTGPAGAGGSGEKWRSGVATGGGILIDHGWHVMYLMQWLMGSGAPRAISAQLGTSAGGGVEDMANLRVIFPEGRFATAHLSWRAALRRTTTTLYGESATIEIEGERVTLTERSGAVEDLSVKDHDDDSYHPSWFAAMAEDFERTIVAGPASGKARQNLAEARIALALILAARESASRGGDEIPILQT